MGSPRQGLGWETDFIDENHATKRKSVSTLKRTGEEDPRGHTAPRRARRDIAVTKKQNQQRGREIIKKKGKSWGGNKLIRRLSDKSKGATVRAQPDDGVTKKNRKLRKDSWAHKSGGGD